MIQNIIILGPFNTGTNLLNNILTNNCFNKINNKYCNIYKNYWKHTLKLDLIEKISNENTLIIIMYKNLFNWIESMIKSKYMFEFDKIQDKINFNLNKTSTKIEKNFHSNIEFKNIIDAYNQYYMSYKKFYDSKNNIIFIDYRKIIDKNNGFNYVNLKLEKFDLYLMFKNEYLNSLSKPSKSHGNTVKNSDEALNNYDLVKNKNIDIVMTNDILKNELIIDLINYYENLDDDIIN